MRPRANPDANSMRQKWLCAQIGAREHYAVPRALDRVGMLQRLYTDLWVGKAGGFLKSIPGFSGLAGRCCDLPSMW